MCLPMWRATIWAPIDRLPVTREPITSVTVLPRKKSACAKADDGSAISNAVSAPQSGIVLTGLLPEDFVVHPILQRRLSNANGRDEPGHRDALAQGRLS